MNIGMICTICFTSAVGGFVGLMIYRKLSPWTFFKFIWQVSNAEMVRIHLTHRALYCKSSDLPLLMVEPGNQDAPVAAIVSKRLAGVTAPQILEGMSLTNMLTREMRDHLVLERAERIEEVKAMPPGELPLHLDNKLVQKRLKGEL